MALTEVADKNGNRATIAYWGSEAAARASLETLRDCKDCSDCSDCLDCSGCSRCSGCSDCLDCSDCSDCSDCLDCSGCSRCSGCSGCSDCSGCSRCSGCSGCSDCSGCSGCLDCSGKKSGKQDHLQPAIPAIPNIHQAVFAAASAPAALNMSTWHLCDTTHCRGGWVIHLAGEAGRALERYWTTNHAAWLIYKASDPAIKHRPDFFCTNAAALADMKRLAEEEAAGALAGAA